MTYHTIETYREDESMIGSDTRTANDLSALVVEMLDVLEGREGAVATVDHAFGQDHVQVYFDGGEAVAFAEDEYGFQESVTFA